MVVEGSDTPHVVGVPVCAYKGPQPTSLTYLAGNVSEDTIFVVLCDVAIYNEVGAARTLDQYHVALPRVNEMNSCAHDPFPFWVTHRSQFVGAHISKY